MQIDQWMFPTKNQNVNAQPYISLYTLYNPIYTPTKPNFQRMPRDPYVVPMWEGCEQALHEATFHCLTHVLLLLLLLLLLPLPPAVVDALNICQTCCQWCRTLVLRQLLAGTTSSSPAASFCSGIVFTL